MHPPSIPEDESQRLEALRRLQILDTPPEERFDRLTRMAKKHFKTSIVLISLVDNDRQWFKSRQGLAACETNRRISFCGHAILDGDLFEVADARNDPRFADNPLVTGPPHIRFYTGAPLTTLDGYRVGTLCLIDPNPRQLSAEERVTLRDFADCVQQELNLEQERYFGELLMNSEARVRALVQALPDRVYIVGADLRFFDCQESPDILSNGKVGKNYDASAIFPAQHVQQCLDMIVQVQTSQSPMRLEFQQHLPSGPVLLEARFQCLDAGAVLVLIRDISHQLELAMLSRVASQTTNGVVVTDTQRRVKWVNEGFTRLTGYSLDELIDKNMGPILQGPLTDVETVGRMRAALNKGISFEEDILNYAKTGESYWLHISCAPLRDPQGQLQGFMAIETDITEQLRSAEALRDQVEHSRTLFDNIVDGILIIDRDGTIQSFNPAAERIFGYPTEKVIGRNVKMLMPNPYHDSHDGYLQNYQKTHIPRIIGIGREVEGLRSDGSVFPMELAVSEITRLGLPNYVGLVRDISERKRIEQMKSEFVSTVSHELRTPLTAISGALGLITGGALPEAAKQQMLAIAYKNSHRLTHLINDLLDMEKITAGLLHFDLQPQDLFPIVEQSVEDNRSYGAARSVSLTLSPAPAHGQTLIRVDSQRLMQVMSNLISNAIKFSPNLGEVKIAVEFQADSALIHVSDLGPGIPASFRARIFQKFAQADASDSRQKGGTGLGLAITRELVQRMDGEITFESQEGKGTTFTVAFPLWRAFDNSPSEGVDATSPCILVVDDEPDVTLMLSMILGRSGFAVDRVHSGQEALQALQHKTYVAMTLDLMLPDLNGIDILRQVRQRTETRDLAVVIISAKVEDGNLAMTGDLYPVDILPKPIEGERLVAIVERTLGQHGTADKPKILIYDQAKDLYRDLATTLGYNTDLYLTDSLNDLEKRIKQKRFDVILLNISKNDSDIWKLLPEIRTRHAQTPVLVLSAGALSEAELQNVAAALRRTQITPYQLLEVIRRYTSAAQSKGDPP